MVRGFQPRQGYTLRGFGIRRRRGPRLPAALDDAQPDARRWRRHRSRQRFPPRRHIFPFPAPVGRFSRHFQRQGRPGELPEAFRLPDRRGRHQFEIQQ
ncbi:unnamed protein product [Nesidiocoris tenuis]|uniref:Uncharacterized protein n=1 Tax=Nesidiocoris tenuis TaxID=355587 RepID=A0A6H5GQY7_9HEMI|nr:unnamed protein product [Nesidiocoris tenuis]